MEMTCLAQVPGALAHIFDGIHLFAGHEGAPVPAKQQPRSAQRDEHDWTPPRRAQDDEKASSRTYARRLRPNLKMRVPPSTPPPDVLGFGRQLPSRSARVQLPRR